MSGVEFIGWTLVCTGISGVSGLLFLSGAMDPKGQSELMSVTGIAGFAGGIVGLIAALVRFLG